MNMQEVRAAFVGTRSVDTAARRLGVSGEELAAFLDNAPDDEVMQLALLIDTTCDPMD